ncbi:hypothetical protein [Gemella morbillorum]|uniref:hypothetical protein n=1 Tax=Gemella morbillorum TaxID=29391 RepID=UPI0028D34B15|nr:hypothetical protein [Gemella morbillorum]
MKEEKHEKESKVKKKLTKIIGTVIVGALLMMTATGCGIMGMGSKSWIEKQVSDIEKVYPTENPEDLFEKFPIGFRIEQRKIFKKDGKNYSVEIVMRGNPKTKKIDGIAREIYREYKPFKETIVKESKVEYVKGEGLVLENPELEDSLLFKKYFLFQKLKLNKDILKKLEVKEKSFSFETGKYNIKYLFTNKEIDNYLGLNKQKVSFDIIGQYSEKDKTYFHSLIIKEEDTKEDSFSEKVVEDKIGEENEE